MHALSAGLLALVMALYLLGLRNLWRRAGAGRGIGVSHAVYFLSGWLVAAVAAISPLHHYAEQLLWLHMVQHEALIALAAPLLVLGRPIEAWSWALRAGARVPRILSDPLFAWALHAATLWLWHAPVFFEAAMRGPWLHFAQHASFFVPALLFWWSVLARDARPLGALLALFATMLHTGALGALMTFARTPWYAGYALEDQQLAGLVMWVPAGLAYPLAALALASRSLRRWAA